MPDDYGRPKRTTSVRISDDAYGTIFLIQSELQVTEHRKYSFVDIVDRLVQVYRQVHPEPKAKDYSEQSLKLIKIKVTGKNLPNHL